MKLVEEQALPSAKQPSGDSVVAADTPKLSIIELMVLTAAMAIAFAFQEFLSSENAGMKADVFWFDALQRVQFAMLYGLPLAAIYRFAIQKKLTGKFLLHPGHWVLFSMLILVVGFMAPYSILLVIFGSTDPSTFFGNWYFLINGIFCLAASISLIPGTWRFKWTWKIVLLALAVNFTMNAVQMAAYSWMFASGNFAMIFTVLGWLDTVSNPVMVVALFPAIWSDFKSKSRRDLWHWMGLLSLFVLGVVTPVLNFIFIRFFAN